VIPLYKLERLPRTQKLRKIAKIFTLAERRLCLAIEKEGERRETAIFTTAEFEFFTNAAKLLTEDFSFSQEAQKAFRETADIFEGRNAENAPAQLRRALNTVKNLLLTETGRDQADWDFIGSDGKLDPVKRQIFEGMRVYLEDIRSPFNVGAMFRTAESFGVEKIFLSQFCADPRHRRAERTAMGCVDIVPWERRDFFSEPPGHLPGPVFALETGGIPLTEFPFPRQGLLIAGSEELGVSPRALAAADASLGRVSIPCYGAKASLNVSVAFGIAVQAWAARMAVDEQ
jgi:TrmH family RNA methyltransferase